MSLSVHNIFMYFSIEHVASLVVRVSGYSPWNSTKNENGTATIFNECLICIASVGSSGAISAQISLSYEGNCLSDDLIESGFCIMNTIQATKLHCAIVFPWSSSFFPLCVRVKLHTDVLRCNTCSSGSHSTEQQLKVYLTESWGTLLRKLLKRKYTIFWI